MRRKLFITILILGSMLSYTHANQQKIYKIRKLYNWVQNAVTQKNKIICNSMLAAIGLQTTTITFFHTSTQVDPESDPYKMQYFLHKVVATYNIAASAHYKIIYLFNKRKELLFYYYSASTMNGDTTKKRLYFSRNKLIRAQISKNKKTKITDKYFSKVELTLAKKAQNKAALYLKKFKETLDSEQIDK